MFNNKNNKKTLIIIGIAKRINTNEIKYNKKRIFQKNSNSSLHDCHKLQKKIFNRSKK